MSNRALSDNCKDVKRRLHAKARENHDRLSAMEDVGCGGGGVVVVGCDSGGGSTTVGGGC